MAERGKEERTEQVINESMNDTPYFKVLILNLSQISKLDVLIKKHEDLIPTVLKTQVQEDLQENCRALSIRSIKRFSPLLFPKN